jgi:hypothetical protein
VPQTRLISVRSKSPRFNLPAAVARKRGESNFLLAFEREYLRLSMKHGNVSWREFAMSGYGIADILILSWSHRQGGGRSLTLEKLKRERLTAFELKLNDWRSALMQAFRYRYFCDRAIVVLPRNMARTAAKHLDQFRRLGIGLWSFDTASGRIRKYHTARAKKPKNPIARERAIQTIFKRLQFRKTLKLVKSRA